MKAATATCALVLFAAVTGAQNPQKSRPFQGEPLVETTIGMRQRIEELPLPGSKLRARPVADPQKAELILRILNVFPHGTGYRYNFEVTPLVAGRLDLRDHLEREDGTPVTDLPELPITVTAVLPAGRIVPNDLEQENPEGVGGYTLLLIFGGVLWVLGLLAILFVGQRRRAGLVDREPDRPLTLADRLRPLVEGAQRGELDHGGRAELERLLLAYWRHRRELGQVKVGEAISILRRDPEAGALLLKLEEWLHSPQPAGAEDIALLLDPYRNAPDVAEKEPA